MKKFLQNLGIKYFLLPAFLLVSFFSSYAQGVHVSSGGDYYTIQEAVDAAPDGATITVDAGLYIENVRVTKSLTIQGPNASISPNGGSRVAEAIIDAGSTGINRAFTVNTSGTQVVIKGFYIQHGSPLHDGDIHRDGSNPANISVTFQNNIVKHANNLFCGTLTRWLNVTISNNLFKDIDYPIVLPTPSTYVSAIQLNDAETEASGLYAPIVTATITDNVIDTTNFAGILLDNIASATVTGNKISHVTDAGIQIASASPGTIIQYNEINYANTSAGVDNGAIRLFGNGNNPSGILASENFTGKADIKNNLITNTYNGFAAMPGANITTDVLVTNNSFALSDKSIYNAQGNTILNASCNWYGTTCQPDVRSKITTPVSPTPPGNVNYLGYLNKGPAVNSSNDGDAAIGFQLSSGTSCVTPTAITEISFTVVNTSCNATDGSITINSVTGGTSPYSYKWSNGQTSATITGLAAGDYTVTITDVYCTSFMKTITVGTKPTPAKPALGAPVTQPTCTNTNGSFTIMNYDGSLTYTVSPSSNVTQSGATITAPAGTYTVTATSGGCTSFASDPITVNPAPSAPAAPTASVTQQPTCSTATGTITVSAPTGSSFTYYLNSVPAGGYTSSNTTGTFTGVPAGSYNVTVKNSSGCTSSASTTITVNAAPSAPAAPTASVTQQPTCTTATGTITVTNPTGSSYTYYLNSVPAGGYTSSNTTGTFTEVPAGSYNVTVKNSSGCTSSASTTITVNPAPSAPAAPTASVTQQPTCSTATGTITVTNPTGSSYTYYLNSVPAGGYASNNTTGTFTGVPAGSYNVTVKNSSGCTSSASTTITVNPAPSAPAAPTASVTQQPTCSTATGTITVTNPTGSSYTYYLNSVPAGGYASNNTTGTFTGVPAGSYNVTVKNSSGCTSSASATITVNAAPSAPAAPTASVTQQPTCITATGTITVTNPTGSSYTYYLNSVPAGGYTSSNTTGTFTGVPAGSYNVTVKNSSGCTSSGTPVTVNAQPSAPAAPTASVTQQPTCSTATGTITVSAPTGSSFTYYLNSVPAGGYTSSNTTGTFTTVPAGSYNVTVKNSSGCTSSASATITVNPAPTGGSITNVTITVSEVNDFCYGITLTANPTPASGTYTYKWSNGATTQSIHLDNSNADGDYMVTVSSGCGSKSATYNYKKQNVADNYTILALSGVDFEQNNNVQKGSVGAENSCGWIYADGHTSIASPGAFAKASYIFVSATSNIPTRIYSPANVPLPAFQSNTSSTSGLSNYTVPDNATVTLTGNYKNLTIGKNANVTVRGSIFYDVCIKSGAYVTFTSSVVNVHSLNVDAGGTRYTTLHFSGSCIVKSSEDINVCSKVRINPENMSVTFYVGDNDCDKDNFTIDGTDTRIYANIYVKGGCIIVNGCNSVSTTCYMTGMFIADYVISKCNYVIWNPHDCQNPGSQIVSGRSSIVESSVELQQAANGITREDAPDKLTVKILPNPSRDHFTLLLKSPYATPVKINIYDGNGHRVEQFQGTPDLKFQFGDSYKPGFYLVDIWQAADHITTKVIKQ